MNDKEKIEKLVAALKGVLPYAEEEVDNLIELEDEDEAYLEESIRGKRALKNARAILKEIR